MRRLTAYLWACLWAASPAAVSAGPLPGPATDAEFMTTTPAQVDLGKLLFFDKILSGNLDISCASCHHAMAATGDGLSLPVGEGGMGLGVTRNTGAGEQAIHERVPRNAPPLFNLGAFEFTALFDDGRVEVDGDQPSGFSTPAGDRLPVSIDSVLAAQAMFPVTSADETAGQAGENHLADVAADGDLPGVWAILAERLRGIPRYVSLFEGAFADVNVAGDITYAYAARAIATYEAATWRADNSPFDQYLRGDTGAMSANAIAGMQIFYGKGGCDACHSGTFQTNQSIQSIGVPQIGPGKGDRMPGRGDGLGDFGRERVTGDTADRFRFRVPPLRNVALTAPYGHAGQYDALQAIVHHYVEPRRSLWNYDTSQAVLPRRPDLSGKDFALMQDPRAKMAIIESLDIAPVDLSDEEVARLTDFLNALADMSHVDLRKDVPPSVPSGLPVFD